VALPPTSTTGTDSLAIGLSVAVVICGLIFTAVLGFYIYLRRGQAGSTGSRGDIQELTTHAHSNGDIEAIGKGFGPEDASPIQVRIIIQSLDVMR
jgi:hypothetical protein